eukprot:866098-Amphidinium_carterae.2
MTRWSWELEARDLATTQGSYIQLALGAGEVKTAKLADSTYYRQGSSRAMKRMRGLKLHKLDHQRAMHLLWF